MTPHTLPDACAAPCPECPWRRDATPGHLGPYSARTWRDAAHGDQPIACHLTIRDADDLGNGDWTHPALRQCAGAATYRRNVQKVPRHPMDAARHVPPDPVGVFTHGDDFIDHHDGTEEDSSDWADRLNRIEELFGLDDPATTAYLDRRAPGWTPETLRLTAMDAVIDQQRARYARGERPDVD